MSFSQSQPLPHFIADLLLILGSALPPHLGGLDIGGTLVIGFSQHAHNGDKDFLDALDGRPALGGVLVVVGVITGGMQDGNADCAIGVD